MNDKATPYPLIPERLPARLTGAQAATLLGFQPHDVRVLVAARLLRPLGNPPPHSLRFFSAAEILELAGDRNWLSRATNAVYQHWVKKNGSGHTEVPTPVELVS